MLHARGHRVDFCGATIVIVSGGIDLAVGSFLALCAALFSILTIGMGWGAAPAIAVTAFAGMICGAVPGGLIARQGAGSLRGWAARGMWWS